MVNIIIALTAIKGREQLSRAIAGEGNYNILPPVASGADVLKSVLRFGGKGVVVCSEHLGDMHYTQLSTMLPDNYKILLIVKSGGGFYENYGNMAMLVLPFTTGNLLTTIQTLSLDLLPKKPQKRLDRSAVEEAKAILIARNNMTEPQAHRFIQKRSMDTRTDINTVCEEIIKLSRS
jgi:response regulator NasT